MKKTKKILLLLTSILLMLSLVACGCDHIYDEGVVTKEPTYESTGTITYTCTECGDSYTEELPVKEQEVTVSVVDKKSVPQDIFSGIISDHVLFKFDVKNETEKDIKGVQGVLYITDLFDEQILSMNCNFTGQILKASAVTNFSNIGMDTNPFIDKEVKLYDTKFEDLKFTYEITDVVFVDGSTNSGSDTPKDTTASSSDSEDASIPVNVTVTKKTNIAQDIGKGILSDRVNFNFDIKNNSTKDIKGIQGIIHVSDLFDKSILSSNCDFTGQTIKASSSGSYSDIGMDINEFIDEQKKLYSEEFSDLKFKYEVTKIVYVDGTVEEF